jgi:purine nucleosidase
MRSRERRITMLITAGLLSIMIGASGQDLAAQLTAPPERPVRFIYDTDIGNDVDDALALGIIHALESRAECALLAVTITKDHELCAAYVDAVNTFYGRGGIPIGVVRNGPTPGDSKFTGLARAEDNGEPRYPHDLKSSADAPDATKLLREVLAAQPDNSVAIAQVGFSTNMARLLDSKPDEYSDLNGHGLVAEKVRLLSVMAGVFQDQPDLRNHLEYNVVKDIPAAQKLAREWPTPIIYSGYEIGIAILYPAVSIDRDYAYAAHHPLQEAYQLYQPTPHERPAWDLTSVLWAIRPDRGYFKLSAPGRAVISDKGKTTFEETPGGRHFYLIADDMQCARVQEILALLASQPPDTGNK